jgi:hypothetical protein
VFGLSLAILTSATACSSALDDAVRGISRSQNVDEATVRTALREAASSEDEQLKLAQKWGSRPARAGHPQLVERLG